MSLTNAYKTGIKRQIVEALAPLFGPDFTIPELRGKVYVGLEYPFTAIKYPAIFITYNEGPVQNAGVGHYEMTDDGDFPLKVRHFTFTGSVSFNIMALSSLDRDRLSATIVDILSFGEVIPQYESFKEDVGNGKYLQLHLILDSITPGGEQIGTVPWNSDNEIQYGNSYSVPVFGEFISDADASDLIQINEVILTPYSHPDQLPPW